MVAPCCYEEFRRVVVGASYYFANESRDSCRNYAAHVWDVVEDFLILSFLIFSSLTSVIVIRNILRMDL